MSEKVKAESPKRPPGSAREPVVSKSPWPCGPPVVMKTPRAQRSARAHACTFDTHVDVFLPASSRGRLQSNSAVPSGFRSGWKARERGATLVEFALVALLLCLLLLVFVDFGRMLLVYNSINNSARAGVRYAIVNGDAGGTRPGSGPAANPADVIAVVINFADSAPLDATLLDPVLHPGAVTVTYPEGSNSIGSLVEVGVAYPYDPLLGYFPLSVTLSGRSQGRIAF